jgi:hypothetical protein
MQSIKLDCMEFSMFKTSPSISIWHNTLKVHPEMLIRVSFAEGQPANEAVADAAVAVEEIVDVPRDEDDAAVVGVPRDALCVEGTIDVPVDREEVVVLYTHYKLILR